MNGTWRLIDEDTLAVFFNSKDYKSGEIRFKLRHLNDKFELNGIDTFDDNYSKVSND